MAFMNCLGKNFEEPPLFITLTKKAKIIEYQSVANADDLKDWVNKQLVNRDITGSETNSGPDFQVIMNDCFRNFMKMPLKNE